MVQGARGVQSTSVGMASRFLDDTDPACAVEVDAPAAVRGEIRRVLVGGLRVEGAFVIVSLRVRFGAKCAAGSPKKGWGCRTAARDRWGSSNTSHTHGLNAQAKHNPTHREA